MDDMTKFACIQGMDSTILYLFNESQLSNLFITRSTAALGDLKLAVNLKQSFLIEESATERKQPPTPFDCLLS